MTLSPFVERNVTDAELPEYEVNTICAHPECSKPAMEKHHMSRRSATTRGYWVKVQGFQKVLPNIVGLCSEHHREVTAELGGHKARIVYRDGRFWWLTFDPFNFVFAPLDPQPEGVHGPETPLEVECPACHALSSARKERRDTGLTRDEGLAVLPKRVKRTWSLAVPKDHQEDGVAILEVLMLEAAKILDRHEHVSYRYYTIIEVLHDWITTNAGKVLR